MFSSSLFFFSWPIFRGLVGWPWVYMIIIGFSTMFQFFLTHNKGWKVANTLYMPALVLGCSVFVGRWLFLHILGALVTHEVMMFSRKAIAWRARQCTPRPLPHCLSSIVSFRVKCLFLHSCCYYFCFPLRFGDPYAITVGRGGVTVNQRFVQGWMAFIRFALGGNIGIVSVLT